MFSEKEIQYDIILYLNEKPYFKFEIRLFILGKMCQKLFPEFRDLTPKLKEFI